jgi:ankyrin repeat protein
MKESELIELNALNKIIKECRYDTDEKLVKLRAALLKSKHLINELNDNKDTCLTKAIKYHNQTLIIELIKFGADVNKSFSHIDCSPLMIACFEKDHFIVKILINSGAHVGKINNNPSPIIHYASRSIECLNILLKTDAINDINSNIEGRTPFSLTRIYSAEDYCDYGIDTLIDDSLKVIRTLVENGADINSVDENGESLIFDKLYFSNPEYIKSLIELGANINVTNNSGITLYQKAINDKCDESILQLLRM